MKKIKLILALFIAVVIIFSCKSKDKKPDTVKVEKKEMSFEKLSDLIGAENAFKIFDSAGKTESDPVAKGARRPKGNAVVVVWLHDIVLTVSGSDITYTTSPNAEWSGVQSFGPAMSKDGAYSIWGCNKYFSVAPPPTVTCSYSPASGEANLRAFTSDHDYTIHVSNVVTVTN